MSLIPVTPDNLAKALLPGLKAVTYASMEKAIVESATTHLKEWLRREFDSTIQTTYDPQTKQLTFLIKIDV